MDKMTRKKALETIFTVFFVGIVLSFSLFFAVTAVFTPNESISEDYFDGSEGNTGIFSAFDDACLKNKSFYDLINEYEYKIFNNIPNKEIVGGDGGFLFNGDTNEYGYNYLDDYNGRIILTEDQLDRFHKYIEMRSRAYENLGSDYVLAVIPNAQTVYSEYMPDYIGQISDNTMLDQISRYLSEQGFGQFIDLSDAMKAGKDRGQLYNNTENTVNAIGAYVAYTEIIKHIEGEMGVDISELSAEHFKLGTRITDGKSLAKKAGLSSLIRNKTLYLSDTNERLYTLVELFGDLETTYVKYEYKSGATDMMVFLECTDDWEKIQLMPYFSSTFYRASYRVSSTFNKSVVTSALPEVVVQIIREDELWSILDEEVTSSYNEGLEHGQNPYQTISATEIAHLRIDTNKYCVTGVVEEGAEVTLFGDGLSTVQASVVEGRFLAVIEVEDESVANQICISVHSSGKSVSDVSYVLISSDDKINYSGSVYVGENGMLYKSDYGVGKLPAAAATEDFVEAVKSYFEEISRKNTYSGAEIIFTLIPDKISVYRDGFGKELQDQAEILAVKRSFLDRALSECGVINIDSVGVLRQLSNSLKTYYQTNDGLTDYASYYLYREIMLTVTDRFYYAAPNSIKSERYSITSKGHGAGVLAEMLGFNDSRLNETADRITVKGRFEYVVEDGGELDFDGEFSTVHRNYDLPTAVVIRDGDCDKLVEMLADNFSTMYVLEKGSVEIPSYILERGVDYVIVLAPESNINISK